MYPQGGPVRAATSCFGFPASFFNSLYEFPLSKVDSLLSGTFSIETLPSESEDNIPAEEESNGSLDEKPASIQETEEESTTEAAMESNQTEEQETMDLAAEDTENKESKEKGNKENVRACIYYFSLESLTGRRQAGLEMVDQNVSCVFVLHFWFVFNRSEKGQGGLLNSMVIG